MRTHFSELTSASFHSGQTCIFLGWLASDAALKYEVDIHQVKVKDIKTDNRSNVLTGRAPEYLAVLAKTSQQLTYTFIRKYFSEVTNIVCLYINIRK